MEILFPALRGSFPKGLFSSNLLNLFRGRISDFGFRLGGDELPVFSALALYSYGFWSGSYRLDHFLLRNCIERGGKLLAACVHNFGDGLKVFGHGSALFQLFKHLISLLIGNVREPLMEEFTSCVFWRRRLDMLSGIVGSDLG